MDIHADRVDPQNREQAWLIYMLNRVVIPATFGLGILLPIYAFFMPVINGIPLTLLVFGYGGVLLWAQWQARRGHIRRAVSTVSVGMLTAAPVVVFLLPRSLPVVLLLPVISVAFALPHLPVRSLRHLMIAAFSVIALLVFLSIRLSPLAPLTTIEGRAMIILSAVAAVLILWLLLHSSSHMARLTEHARAFSSLSPPLPMPNGEESTRLAELHTSARRYRTIAEMTSDYVYEICIGPDRTFELVYITDAFTRTTGYSVAEATADFNNPTGAWSQLFHPDDLPIFFQHFNRACSGTQDTTEFRIINKQGDIRWICDEMHSIWDEQQQRVVRLVGVARDITRLKQEEHTRQMLEERFTKAFQSSPIPMSISTMEEGRFIDVNERFTQFSGYSYEELVGYSAIDDLNIWVNPQDRDDMLNELRAEGCVRDRLYSFRTRLGTIMHAMLSMESVTLDDERCLLATIYDITDRLVTEARLRESEALLDSIYQVTDTGLVVTDEEGYILRVNQAYCEMYRVPYPEPVGSHISSMLLLDQQDTAARYYQTFLNGSQKIISEYRAQRQDGSMIDVYLTSRPLLCEDGRRLRILSVTDITEYKQTIEALRISEERFRNLFNNSPDAILVETPDGTVLDVNHAACRLYGLTREQMLGLHIADSALELAGNYDEAAYEPQTGLARELDFFEGLCKTSTGRTVPVEVRTSHITYLGQPAMLLHMRDVSERERTARQLYQLANHDTLTKLPNRKLFGKLLKEVVQPQPQALPAHPPVAVMVIDLDHFKSINDSLGHYFGDKLLVVVAQRLKDCLRPEDTVARIGSDEFALLLQGVQDVTDATVVAERLCQAITVPVFIDGYEMTITASIGIALSSPVYDNAQDILRDAGTAMYYAKELDANTYMVFDISMHERARERQQIRLELPQAIERGELRLYYQPIVELSSGEIAGFETLVRWQHPRRGLLSPSDFVPIAEETDTIILLGQWVLNEACRQARLWSQQLPWHDRTFALYVNLSGREFRDPDLVRRIGQLLSSGNLGNFKLKLEITEGTMMDNADTTIGRLHSLLGLGVELCIDDFGTGYSSLRYLQRFPVQTVKIDHSFVLNLGEEQESESTHIVKAILLMAHALNMNVIAEWVETPDQFAQLQAMGCEYGQGYLFSRPLRSEAAFKMLCED